MENLETEKFKVSSYNVILNILFIKGKPWLILIFTGLLIFLVSGFLFNYKWFLVMLMWIFTATPLLMAFLYFFYGLAPLTASNSILHSVSFPDDKIIVKLYKENDDKEISVLYSHIKDLKDFHEYYIKTDCLILSGKTKEGILIIPLDIIAEGALHNILSYFRKNQYAVA